MVITPGGRSEKIAPSNRGPPGPHKPELVLVLGYDRVNNLELGQVEWACEALVREHERSMSRRPRPRALPWKKKGLSRVERVIAFLEFLPITKGILAGTKMKLLPGQRKFVQAIYGRLSKDGRRKIRIAIKSEPRGGGKTGLIAGLCLAHLLGS